MIYIATFFSHYGAIQYNKELKKVGIVGTLMPVPRSLSSSCGTCVKFEAVSSEVPVTEETESIVKQESNEYVNVFKA